MSGYDGRLDWVDFYRSQGVGRLKRSGSKHTGLCPLHDNTKTPAFWFTTENGMWKCEAGCGQGNPTQFVALKQGISTGEADKMLCQLAGVERGASATREPRPSAYTLEDYAAEKCLSVDKLIAWGVRTGQNGKHIVVPYAPGEAVRRRHAPGATRRFTWQTARVDGANRMVGETCLYGLWRLPEWTKNEPIVLVEGESDCHALWSLGIPALGCPGATTFSPSWSDALVGHLVLIHDEGDSGAEHFLRHTIPILTAAGIEVRIWSTPDDVKDPSEFYRLHQKAALDPLLAELAAASVPRDELFASDVVEDTLLGRRGLACPRGWKCDEHGVWMIDSSKEIAQLVSSTPVLLSKRLIDSSTGEERIELVFLRDGAWRELSAARDAVFSARTVVSILAPRGVQVTSENARRMVSWLAALEQTNMGALPAVRSCRSLGWCGDAFVPTNPRGVVLDLASDSLVSAVRTQGTLQDWLKAVGPHRVKSALFRFILAGGFAAPLLRDARERNFFIYNSGRSKGGKTAALKAALSVWGDPIELISTFNATSVGLERRAALLRDLPLGIDELQSASGDQRQLDELVYDLANGTGRARGAKHGGIQDTLRWRSVIICTGEVGIRGASSQTGVATRVLELAGAPFTSEDEAAAMHRALADHFGHAGPRFIEQLLAQEPMFVATLNEQLVEALGPYATRNAKSHLAAVALVCAADVMVSMWIIGDERNSALGDAVVLGRTILGLLVTEAAGDVDEAACQFVVDWLLRHAARFEGSSAATDTYGSRTGEKWLVLPTVLREALEKQRFDYRRTMTALAARGALDHEKNRFTKSARVCGAGPKHMLCIDSSRLGPSDDSLEAQGEETPF